MKDHVGENRTDSEAPKVFAPTATISLWMKLHNIYWALLISWFVIFNAEGSSRKHINFLPDGAD